METLVITGASSGIGRELALQSARPGRLIWLLGRDQGRLAEAAGEVRARGAEARTAALDLTDFEACRAFLEAEFPAGGSVSTVYLVAAVTLFGEVKEVLPDDWRRIYETDLLGQVQWLLHFYRGMVEAGGGRIVLVSSLAAYAGYPTAVPYATMKAGLLGLFRSLRHEAKAHGVALHLASPGYVDTGIYKAATFRATSYERTIRQIHSLGFRILSAGEAAATILRRVEAGRKEFALPGYASLLKWLAPRLPGVIGLIHRRIIHQFRSQA